MNTQDHTEMELKIVNLEKKILELKRLESGKWISVKDRLPQKFGEYICCGDTLSSATEVIEFFDLEWRWTDDRTLATGVAHWQPMPERISD
jgi:hypothetical protein